MFTGKRFLLTTPTLAVADTPGKRSAVTIPAGEIVKVVSGPINSDRMVDVVWNGRMLAMFAIDITERGQEVRDGQTSA